MNDTTPTVFIVDDDPDACSSVSALVSSMGVNTKEYHSAEEFLAHYNPKMPGCVITDMRMSGMSGIELLSTISGRSEAVPVIVITAFAEVPLAVRAMKQGAVTLLEKPCGKNELWNAIQDALERDRRRRERDARLDEIRHRLDQLSPQENDVLTLMLEGKPNKVIASRLDVSVRTVESRRQSIFEKLKSDSVAELVRTVLEVRPVPASS